MLRFWLFALTFIFLQSPALAQRWQTGETPEMGVAAALTDHPVLPVILLVCQSGQMHIWVQLDNAESQPPKGEDLVIGLMGEGEGVAPLYIQMTPTGTANEYIALAQPNLLDLLISPNTSLAFSYSIDGGSQFSRGKPNISLAGSTAAVGKARSACGQASAANKAPMVSSEAEVRATVTKGYSFYKIPFGTAPASYPSLSFSADLDRRIEQTDDGILGYDPLCMCQDYDETKFRFVIDSIELQSGTRATVNMRIAAVGGIALQPVQLKMILEKGKWVVDDIIDANGSLRESLR